MTSYQRLLVQHGLIILFLGLVGGFMLLFAVLGQISLSPIPLAFGYVIPGDPAQWRAVHVGNIMNGLMAIIFALLIPLLTLSEKATRNIAIGLVCTIWGNALFYIFGILTPNKGLSLGDNPVGEANWAAPIAFMPAFIVAFVLMVIVVVMLRNLPAADDTK
ncbi:Styrene oxide isomerase [Candidatus Phaeomarinobacter ectocarpi]|uniref:Styrene oxide isomerase n=1 Tax=Candidatus Phaeomarinibacter ectocarpi TaxID=1458461 RepID=X5MG00_9HYPH|nr:hypothetical protein [Candidatus Phaeomarinobacter ectocarpi]CDO60294.1 Styrene oxide isomerase [Candidatus Phaeomarinobacter ectocarpi]